jgi:beta-glucosidase
VGGGESLPDAPPLLEVRGLAKRFRTGGLFDPRQVFALEDVSFAVARREVVALVGESGSGKSTTARIVARLESASAGAVLLEGRDVLREEPRGASARYRRRIQMIFQDPFASLNPVKSVAQHLERPLVIHGRASGPAARGARVYELLHDVGLEPAEEIAAKLPHQLSGGQRQRVAIARALAVEPDLILADEPVSMLDVSVRTGILNLFERLKTERNIAWLYITHDLASARYLADRILVMYRGRLVEGAAGETLVGSAAHPYTRLLLASVPDARCGLGQGVPPRSPPSSGSSVALAGCPFAAACPEVMDVCRAEMPGISPLGEGHWVRCHLYASEQPARERPRDDSSRLRFPEGFVWGAATSAYQIEGATREDGRGESIWDRFCLKPGRVEGGATGDVACDHYHRFAQDVELMAELGLGAYRFSVSWPRVLPRARGVVNQAGLDFYSRLVDALLSKGITPFVTLFHWDLPQVLDDEGGWPSRATVDAFVEYADVVSRRLGDRVRHWITHNEPWCAGLLGHQQGRHAPGLQDWRAALAACHHLLLSHGRAVPVVRGNSRGSEVGISLNLTPATAASPSKADAEAARHFDGYFNRWFLDPLFGRGYPRDMLADYAAAGHLPPSGPAFVEDEDFAAIAAPIDFLGVNYYTRMVVRSASVPEGQNERPTVDVAPSSELTEMGWEVHPDGLDEILSRLRSDYAAPKLYVTENGCSYSDGPDAGGRIRDERRIRFLRDHVVAAHRALTAGAPLAGYFVWSVLDNFEWERGYGQRFGLYWVDYATQQRIPKDSALWYRDVIAANGL